MKKIIVFFISLFMLLNSSMIVLAEEDVDANNSEVIQETVDASNDNVANNTAETSDYKNVPDFTAYFEETTGDLVISSNDSDWINSVTSVRLVATNASVSTTSDRAHVENGDMYLIKYSDPTGKELTYEENGVTMPSFTGGNIYDEDVYAEMKNNATGNGRNKYTTSTQCEFYNDGRNGYNSLTIGDDGKVRISVDNLKNRITSGVFIVYVYSDGYKLGAMPGVEFHYIAPRPLGVTYGDTIQFAVGTKEKVNWSVSDSEVASITDNGFVTFKKSGTVTISATTGAYTDTYTVESSAKYVSVSASQDSKGNIYIRANDKEFLKALAEPRIYENGNKVSDGGYIVFLTTSRNMHIKNFKSINNGNEYSEISMNYVETADDAYVYIPLEVILDNGVTAKENIKFNIGTSNGIEYDIDSEPFTISIGCKPAPTDIIISENNNGDIIISSGDKDFLKELCRTRESYQVDGYSINGSGFYVQSDPDKKGSYSEVDNYNDYNSYHLVYSEDDNGNGFVTWSNRSIVQRNYKNGIRDCYFGVYGYGESDTYSLTISHGVKTVDNVVISENDTEVIIKGSGDNINEWYANLVAGFKESYLSQIPSDEGSISVNANINGTYYSGNIQNIVYEHENTTDSYIFIKLVNDELHISKEKLKEAYFVDGVYNFEFRSSGFANYTVNNVNLHFNKTVASNKASSLSINNAPIPSIGQSTESNKSDYVFNATYADGTTRMLNSDEYYICWTEAVTEEDGKIRYVGTRDDVFKEGKQYYLAIEYRYQWAGNDKNIPLVLNYNGTPYDSHYQFNGVAPGTGLRIYDVVQYFIPVTPQTANIYDVYLNGNGMSIKLEAHKQGNNDIVWEAAQGDDYLYREMNKYFATNYRNCTVTYKTADGAVHTADAQFKSTNAAGRHAMMIVIEENNNVNYIAPFVMGSAINDGNITKVEADINGKTYEFKAEYRVHDTDVYLLDESVDRNSLSEFIDIRIFHESGNIEGRRIYTRNQFMSIGMGLNYKGERYYFDADGSADNMVIIAYDVFFEDISDVTLYVDEKKISLEKQTNKYDFNNLGVQIVYNVDGRNFSESDWQNYNAAINSDNYYITYKKDGQTYTLKAPFAEQSSVTQFGLLEKVVTDNATYTFIVQNRGGVLLSEQIERAYINVDGNKYNLEYSESDSTDDTKIYVLNEVIDSEKLNNVNNVNIVFKGTNGQVFSYGSLNNIYYIGNKVYTGVSIDYYGENGSFATYIFAVRVAVVPVSNAKIHVGDVTVDLTLDTWWENDRQNRVWRFDYENDGEDADRAHDLFRNENTEFYLTYENAEGNEIKVDQDKFSMQNNYDNHGWMYNLSVDDFDYTFIAFGDGFAISSPTFNAAWVETESGRINFVKSNVYSTDEYDVYVLADNVNVDDIRECFIENSDGFVTRFGGRSKYTIDDTVYVGGKVYYTENGNPDKFFMLAVNVFRNNIHDVKFYAGDNLVKNATSQVIYTQDGMYYEWMLVGEDNYEWYDYFGENKGEGYKLKATYLDDKNILHTVNVSDTPVNAYGTHGYLAEADVDGIKHVFNIHSTGPALDPTQIKEINIVFGDNSYSITHHIYHEDQDVDVFMINGDTSAENFEQDARLVINMNDRSRHTYRLDGGLPLEDKYYYRGFSFYDASSENVNRQIVYATKEYKNALSNMVLHANGIDGKLSPFMNGGYGSEVVFFWDFEEYNDEVDAIYRYILNNGTDYYVTYSDETGKEHRIDGPFEEGNYLWCHGYGKELYDNGTKHIILAGYIGQCIEDTDFNRAYVEVDGIEYEFNISDKLSADGRVVYLLDEKCDVSRLTDEANIILEYDSHEMNIYGKDYYVASDELQFTGGYGYFTANGNENNVMIFATKVLRNTISDVKLHFGDYVENLVLNTDSHYHYMIEGDGLSFIWNVQWDSDISIVDFEDSNSYYLTYKDSNGEEHRINGPFPSSNNYDMHSFSYVADIDGYSHCFALNVGPSFDRGSFVDAYTTVDGKDYSYIYSEELSYEGREVYVLDENCDLSLAERMRTVVVKHEGYSYEIDTGVRYVYDDCIFTGIRMFYSNEESNDNVVIFADKVIMLPKIITKPSTKTGLVYNGRSQTLITAGTAENAEFRYALGNSKDELPALEDFSKELPTAVNAGTYHVFYGVFGEESVPVVNYIGSTVIAKATPDPVLPTTLKAVYGNTLGSVALDSHYMWVNPGQSVGNATIEGRKFGAKYTPDDTDNYKEIFVELNVIVLKANNTAPAYTGVLEAQKDTKLSEIKLDTGWSWLYPNSTVSDVNLAKYVNSDPENLNDVIVSLPVSIVHKVTVEGTNQSKEVSVTVKVEETKDEQTTQATDVKLSNDKITESIIDVASKENSKVVVDNNVAEVIKNNDKVEIDTSFVKEEKQEMDADTAEKAKEFLDSDSKTPEMILDLSIDVTVKAGDKVETGKMTELAKPVVVTIDLPATAKVEAEPGTKISYFVIIMHGEKAEKKEATLDESSRSVSFETDKFSTYVLVSEVEKISVPGDLNSDGKINGLDRILLRNYLTKKISAEEIDLVAADVNCDGNVNAQDRVYLRNLVTGKIK